MDDEEKAFRDLEVMAETYKHLMKLMKISSATMLCPVCEHETLNITKVVNEIPRTKKFRIDYHANCTNCGSGWLK